MALVRERTILTDRYLSAKLVPTLSDGGGCCVVSATDRCRRNLGFLYRS
jgi:hypothetical protein